MFDAILDILFPLVLLGVPMVAAASLAGWLFGKPETIAVLRDLGVVVAKVVMDLGRRTHRAALAFISDEAIPAVGNTNARRIPFCDAGELMMEISRLDDRIDRLREYVAERDTDDVEASAPF